MQLRGEHVVISHCHEYRVDESVVANIWTVELEEDITSVLRRLCA
jgi:hypothetical protein